MMKAMVFTGAGRPLELREVEVPRPGRGELGLRVRACGVCRTDLHLLDGELPDPKLPVIPGHQVVAAVETVGEGVSGFARGDRVGVPWLGRTCGSCDFCRRGEENLCPDARFTGYTLDGGYAEAMVADQRFAFPLPPESVYGDLEVAPLLCAGLIGFRSLRLCGPPEHARRVGLFGFGAAAHIIAQVIRHRGGEVFAFTRPGDLAAQAFARSLGVSWAGGSDEAPPAPLDAAIIFAPAGPLVPAALKTVRPGGRVVCGGIHMSDIPSFPYADLWGERMIRSVANLTRRDGEEFLELAPRIPVRTTVTTFRLEEANEALAALREGAFDGAAVLRP